MILCSIKTVGNSEDYMAFAVLQQNSSVRIRTSSLGSTRKGCHSNLRINQEQNPSGFYIQKNMLLYPPKLIFFLICYVGLPRKLYLRQRLLCQRGSQWKRKKIILNRMSCDKPTTEMGLSSVQFGGSVMSNSL